MYMPFEIKQTDAEKCNELKLMLTENDYYHFVQNGVVSNILIKKHIDGYLATRLIDFNSQYMHVVWTNRSQVVAPYFKMEICENGSVVKLIHYVTWDIALTSIERELQMLIVFIFYMYKNVTNISLPFELNSDLCGYKFTYNDDTGQTIIQEVK
mgnify:CR=1 FL=1